VSAIVLYNFEINCTICLRGVLTLPVLWGFQCIVPALVIFQFFRIKFIFLESLHFFLQTDRMDFQNTNFKGQKKTLHSYMSVYRNLKIRHILLKVRILTNHPVKF
jgi:hypothetical protein